MRRDIKKILVSILLVSTILFIYGTVRIVKTENKPSDVISRETLEIRYAELNRTNDTTKNIVLYDATNDLKKADMKYILQWTSQKNVPFVYMGVGQEGFISRNCPFTNCFVTSNKTYLGDYTEFDVIAFSGPEIVHFPPFSLPKRRSPHQKYVFASIESSDYYPVCSNRFDGFFNWTWTFRLDSESRWGYFIIRDTENKIIGPNKIMHWLKLEDMKPVTPELKEELKLKTKTAAWFVSNCYSRRGREKIVKKLSNELAHYNLTVDIYGKCGPLSCPRSEEDECEKMIKKNYFFYLSFENSFSEDYVTEKLLHGLQNNAIPIVFGAANYTRFMPDGIYLNAIELGVEKLAKKMHELINDPESYFEYFRWKNHYSYHKRAESVETDDYCGFCTLLNNEEMVKKKSVYEHFRKWWDSPPVC